MKFGFAWMENPDGNLPAYLRHSGKRWCTLTVPSLVGRSGVVDGWVKLLYQAESIPQKVNVNSFAWI